MPANPQRIPPTNPTPLHQPEWIFNNSSDRIPTYNSLSDPYCPLRKSQQYVKGCQPSSMPTQRQREQQLSNEAKHRAAVIGAMEVANVAPKKPKKKTKKTTAEWVLDDDDLEAPRAFGDYSLTEGATGAHIRYSPKGTNSINQNSRSSEDGSGDLMTMQLTDRVFGASASAQQSPIEGTPKVQQLVGPTKRLSITQGDFGAQLARRTTIRAQQSEQTPADGPLNANLAPTPVDGSRPQTANEGSQGIALMGKSSMAFSMISVNQLPATDRAGSRQLATASTSSRAAARTNNDDLLAPMSEGESILYHWYDHYDDISSCWAYFGVNAKEVSQRRSRDDTTRQRALLEGIEEDRRFREGKAADREEKQQRLADKARERLVARQGVIEGALEAAMKSWKEMKEKEALRRLSPRRPRGSRADQSLLRPGTSPSLLGAEGSMSMSADGRPNASPPPPPEPKARHESQLALRCGHFVLPSTTLKVLQEDPSIREAMGGANAEYTVELAAELTLRAASSSGVSSPKRRPASRGAPRGEYEHLMFLVSDQGLEYCSIKAPPTLASSRPSSRDPSVVAATEGLTGATSPKGPGGSWGSRDSILVVPSGRTGEAPVALAIKPITAASSTTPSSTLGAPTVGRRGRANSSVTSLANHIINSNSTSTTVAPPDTAATRGATTTTTGEAYGDWDTQSATSAATTNISYATTVAATGKVAMGAKKGAAGGSTGITPSPYVYLLPEYQATLAGIIEPDTALAKKVLHLPSWPPASRMEIVDRLTNPKYLATMADVHKSAAGAGGWSAGAWALNVLGSVETVQLTVRVVAVAKPRGAAANGSINNNNDSTPTTMSVGTTATLQPKRLVPSTQFDLYEGTTTVPMADLTNPKNGQTNVTIATAIVKALEGDSSYDWATCPSLVSHKGHQMRLRPTAAFAPRLGPHSGLLQLWADPVMMNETEMTISYLQEKVVGERDELAKQQPIPSKRSGGSGADKSADRGSGLGSPGQSAIPHMPPSSPTSARSVRGRRVGGGGTASLPPIASSPTRPQSDRDAFSASTTRTRSNTLGGGLASGSAGGASPNSSRARSYTMPVAQQGSASSVGPGVSAVLRPLMPRLKATCKPLTDPSGDLRSGSINVIANLLVPVSPTRTATAANGVDRNRSGSTVSNGSNASNSMASNGRGPKPPSSPRKTGGTKSRSGQPKALVGVGAESQQQQDPPADDWEGSSSPRTRPPTPDDDKAKTQDEPTQIEGTALGTGRQTTEEATSEANFREVNANEAALPPAAAVQSATEAEI